MKRGVNLYALVVCACFILGLGWFLYQRSGKPDRRPVPPKSSPIVPESPQPPQAAGRIAIVIDDVAYNTTQLDHFAELGVPLTFAILPRSKLSKALSEKARQLQFAVLLHMPMEPQDVLHNDPGPSGLYLRMSDRELKDMFDKNVNSVPGLQGINNHMGSAFTEDEEKMKLVLGWVKERGLFFLDSYTSTKSKVMKAAKAVQIPCRRNETFLDNEDTVEGIERQLDVAMKLALKHRQTIAIGHYRRKFIIEALKAKIPEFKAHGIEFVTLPTLYPK